MAASWGLGATVLFWAEEKLEERVEFHGFDFQSRCKFDKLVDQSRFCYTKVARERDKNMSKDISSLWI
ncbi:hypothetical protein V6N13_042758 [Hibiscus sabdariffa]|uniref:Uncharacterized protein n=1 Tax=Hibiscus sabdariffa TaxID=183260 RepID=A0ABR2G3S7_9ROSI